MQDTVIDVPSSLLDQDDDSTWKRPQPNQDDQEPAPKKRRLLMDDKVAKKRDQRMLGMLMGTLKTFQKQEKKETQSEAAKRRSAIEEKLATKLRTENQEIERISARSRTEKSLKLDVIRKEEEKAFLDSVYRKRQAAALNLANYLCTSVPADVAQTGEPIPPSVAIRPLISPSLPLHTTPAHAQPPIYFLPTKLLPDQAKQLADQAAAARKAVDADKDDWADEVRARQDELDELRRKRDDGLADIERELRAEKAQADRERRDREDDDGAHTNGNANGRDDASPAPMDTEQENAAY